VWGGGTGLKIKKINQVGCKLGAGTPIRGTKPARGARTGPGHLEKSKAPWNVFFKKETKGLKEEVLKIGAGLLRDDMGERRLTRGMGRADSKRRPRPVRTSPTGKVKIR